MCLIALFCIGGYTLYALLREPAAPSTAVSKANSSGTAQRRSTAKPGTSPSKPAQAPAKPSVAGASEPGPAAAEADVAVRRALQDLQVLPYEEVYGHTLADNVSRIDKALLQVLRRLELPVESLRPIAVVELISQNEPYTFRRLDVFISDRGEMFERELGQTLRVWAENATLRRLDPNTLEIIVKGVRTHLLLLHPGMPPASGAADRSGRQRLRRADEEARLTIVIDDLGANMGAVRKLLALNYPVTFAFWPHAAYVREGAEAAHAAGREILVHLPMEPEGYPSVKPGPGVLLHNASPEQIRELTDRALARVPYAVGLNNHMGSRFTRSREGVRVVLQELRKRNLFMLDSLTHPRSVFYNEALVAGVPAHCRDVFLDHVISRQAILAALRRAEDTALLTGRAVAIGHPHPQTLEVLKDWETLRNPAVRIVRLQELPR